MSKVYEAPPYKVIDSLQSFHWSKARSRLIVGPFRSGKSVAAVRELLQMALEMPINEIPRESIQENVIARTICVRKTYPMLRDSVIKTFFQWIPQLEDKWSKSELTYRFPLGNGFEWEVLFRSAESPEDIDKFKGVEITNFWLDEAVELDVDIKYVLEGRRSYPAGCPEKHFRSILTSNPCATDHWMYRLYVENPLPSHEYYRQSARENPYLHHSYYDELEMQYRDRPEMKRRYVDGEWGSVFPGKAVYGNEFNWDIHVSKKHLTPIKGIPIDCGWDFGLSPACIFTQVNPNGQWMILRELWSDDMGIDEFSDAVIDLSNREFPDFTFKDVGDPAGKARATTDEKSCYDILRSKKRSCREARTNALVPRLEAVKRKLQRSAKGHPQLIIDPRCKRLIDGFGGGYAYIERKTSDSYKSYADRPEKSRFSHIHDALQYVALNLFSYVDHFSDDYHKPLQVRGVVGA